MARFKFRLDSFLNLKEHEEKTAWNEVLKQQGLVSNLTNQIDTIICTIKNMRKRMSQVGQVGATIEEAENLHTGIEAFQIKLEDLKMQRINEEKVLDKLKHIHIEKKRDAKILDNLRSRKQDEYKKDQTKKKELKADDVVNMMLQKRAKNHE